MDDIQKDDAFYRNEVPSRVPSSDSSKSSVRFPTASNDSSVSDFESLSAYHALHEASTKSSPIPYLYEVKSDVTVSDLTTDSATPINLSKSQSIASSTDGFSLTPVDDPELHPPSTSDDEVAGPSKPSERPKKGKPSHEEAIELQDLNPRLRRDDSDDIQESDQSSAGLLSGDRANQEMIVNSLPNTPSTDGTERSEALRRTDRYMNWIICSGLLVVALIITGCVSIAIYHYSKGEGENATSTTLPPANTELNVTTEATTDATGLAAETTSLAAETTTDLDLNETTEATTSQPSDSATNSMFD